MKIDVIYPASGRSFDRRRLVRVARWPFLAVVAGAVAVNLAVGGPAWSPVVIWGLYMAWSNLVAPSMVGYNRLSQVLKLLVQGSIMLVLVDLFLVGKKLLFVLPMIGFSGLTVLAVLFFSDMRRQRQNVMPLILFSLALLVSDVVGTLVQKTWPWTAIVLGVVSFVLLVACVASLGKLAWTGWKKYFHIK